MVKRRVRNILMSSHQEKGATHGTRLIGRGLLAHHCVVLVGTLLNFGVKNIEAVEVSVRCVRGISHAETVR